MGAGVVFAGVLSAGAFSQSPTPTGALSGKLTDLYARPVAEATLVLRNTVSGAEARTTTTKDGSYRFRGLAAGE